ncbi:MAG TPA: translocation/assembly module TamB domain-containing protein, partial [Woeseiaceae bacterium]|nr:translocation/assembly module TamB domain-containing protein [Woeseiaceae bacterium]
AIELEFATDGLQTMLALNGTIDDWKAPGKWTGQVLKLQLQHTDFSAGLSNPAAIVVTAQSASIDDLCIANERGSSFCANGSWARSTGARLSASLSSVPASLINAFAQTGFEFNQMLTGEMDWRMAKNGRSSGWADISMSSGAIASAVRPDLKLETGEANLRFRIASNSLRSGVLDVPLPGLGQIAARFDVLDVAGRGPGTLQGRIDVDVSDVGFVEAVIPALDDVRGRLAADFFLSGPISQPVVTGNVSLDDGAVSYLPIGLELTQVSLDGKLGEAGDIEMTGSFVAGDGRGQIRTRTKNLQAARSGLQIELQGENLTLIDVPDLRAVADTDVTVGFDGETLQLDGKVDVPYARIKPQNIGINRVSESNDVVIVNGELPEGPEAGKSDTDILFNGAIELSLGKDVVVDLDVADATLSGSAVFTWNGPPMPTANGRYVLNGEILAYGQKLEISEGAIRFPNVPASNPNLRIRAEREIFGNTQVRSAGVLVSGSASRPTIEAYTTPMTTEERALTLLVTGSEFDYEKGVGAFDFGTYIAPRVYASYGIGLFDQENVIRVRYDLTEGFGLTLTSGAR